MSDGINPHLIFKTTIQHFGLVAKRIGLCQKNAPFSSSQWRAARKSWQAVEADIVLTTRGAIQQRGAITDKHPSVNTNKEK